MIENLDLLNLLKKLCLQTDSAGGDVLKAGLINTEIFLYRDKAASIWEEFFLDFKRLESQNNLPFTLNSGVHYYAVDTLVVSGIFTPTEKFESLAGKLYSAIFLLCSYYDDHVENREKLFNKFSFEKESDLETQQGALPFSITMLLYELLLEYLTSLEVPFDQRFLFIKKVNNILLSCTQYLARERDKSLTPDEVLEIKQHNVSGKIIALIAEIIHLYAPLGDEDRSALYKGLHFAGSLMQMTDDVRDSVEDRRLKNANLFNAYKEMHGDELGTQYFCEGFIKEYNCAERYLLRVMDQGSAKKILSIPFYPFCF